MVLAKYNSLAKTMQFSTLFHIRASFWSFWRNIHEKASQSKQLIPSDARVTHPVEDCNVDYIKRDIIMKRESRMKDPYKADILPSEKELSKDQNLLMEIRKSESPNQLSLIYLKDREMYLWSHYLGTLEQFSYFLQQGLLTVTELHSDVYFQAFSFELYKKLPNFEVQHILLILETLIDIKIRSDSLIFVSVLQMIRHQINLISMQEVLLLKSLLKKIPESPLSNAILEALPFILENHLQDPIRIYFSTEELCEMIYICSCEYLTGVDTILDYLYDYHLPKILHFKKDPWLLELMMLISALYRIPNKMRQKETDKAGILLNHCTKAFAEFGLIYLTEDEILKLLEKLRNNVAKGRKNIIDEDFLDTIAKHAVQSEWNLRNLLYLTHLLFKLNFVVDELVLDVANKISKSKGTSLSITKALELISIFAISNTKNFTEDARHVIQNHLTVDPEEFLSAPWLRFCLDLFSLGIYDELLVNKILSPAFLEKYKFKSLSTEYSDASLLKDSIINGSLHYSLSDDVLSLLKPSSNKKIDVNKWNELSSPLKYLLRHFSFCVMNVTLKDNLILDFLIAMDPNGLPISFGIGETKNIHFFELKNIPSNSKLIALFTVPNSYVYRPNSLLDNRWQFLETTIKKAGIDYVIPITQDEVNPHKTENASFLRKKLSPYGLILREP